MLQRPLQFNHNILREYINEGNQVIDATVGNGHDTSFLAELVGETGQVYGFDIQEDAIKRTKEKLIDKNLDDRVTLFQSGHENIQQLLGNQQKFSAVVFNLGYLPRGDKNIITTPKTTISALEQSIEVLLPGGILSVMVYFGHPGGKEEKDSVLQFAKNLPQEKFTVYRYQIINQINNPPFLLLIEKK